MAEERYYIQPTRDCGASDYSRQLKILDDVAREVLDIRSKCCVGLSHSIPPRDALLDLLPKRDNCIGDLRSALQAYIRERLYTEVLRGSNSPTEVQSLKFLEEKCEALRGLCVYGPRRDDSTARDDLGDTASRDGRIKKRRALVKAHRDNEGLTAVQFAQGLGADQSAVRAVIRGDFRGRATKELEKKLVAKIKADPNAWGAG